VTLRTEDVMKLASENFVLISKDDRKVTCNHLIANASQHVAVEGLLCMWGMAVLIVAAVRTPAS
jgi:hypothetical protein